MGIPGFTKWLRSRYGACFHEVALAPGKCKPLQQQLRAVAAAPRSFDHVHWDLNARLYLVAERAKDSTHLVKLWLRDLHQTNRWAGAKRSITLSVDGVPPPAKLWTQRLRRHTRSASTPQKRRGGGGRGSASSLSHDLTLGTPTMQRVGEALPFFAVQALQQQSAATGRGSDGGDGGDGGDGVRYLVSGPDVPGEGEHKLQVLRTHARTHACAHSPPNVVR